MTKNSMNTKGPGGKSEEPEAVLTRFDELLAEANLLRHLGDRYGLASYHALADARLTDVRDQALLDRFAPTAAPAKGGALPMTLVALETLRGFDRGTDI